MVCISEKNAGSEKNPTIGRKTNRNRPKKETFSYAGVNTAKTNDRRTIGIVRNVHSSEDKNRIGNDSADITEK
jgi:hypothetical protein